MEQRVTRRALARHVRRVTSARQLYLDNQNTIALVTTLRRLEKRLPPADRASISAAIHRLDELWMSQVDSQTKLSRALRKTWSSWRMTPRSRQR